MLHGCSVQHSPPVDLLVGPVELAVMQQNIMSFVPNSSGIELSDNSLRSATGFGLSISRFNQGVYSNKPDLTESRIVSCLCMDTSHHALRIQLELLA
jgi:hypothetical protein